MVRDLTLVERLSRLHPAVVADCLDRQGLRRQVLAPHIRPLTPTMRLAGFAATVHCIEVDAVPESRDDWYRNELAFVDALQPGDLVLGDHDGVVTIPAELGEEIVARAEEKLNGENLVREKLVEGMSVSEAFRTYGVI